MSLDKGTVAVALVNGQIRVVRGARTHTHSDRLLDVELFKPYSQNIFVPDSCSRARIFPSDLRAVFPSTSPSSSTDSLDSLDSMASLPMDRNILELPYQAFSEYIQLSSGHKRRMDKVWGSASGKMKIRFR